MLVVSTRSCPDLTSSLILESDFDPQSSFSRTKIWASMKMYSVSRCALPSVMRLPAVLNQLDVSELCCFFCSLGSSIGQQTLAARLRWAPFRVLNSANFLESASKSLGFYARCCSAERCGAGFGPRGWCRLYVRFVGALGTGAPEHSLHWTGTR